MYNLKSFLSNLPEHPGIYQMLGSDHEILYVGKAKNLKRRISSYFSSRAKDPKTDLLVSQIKDIDITLTTTENAAVLLECNLIKKHRPRFNILLRDDKSYPYIYLSQHSFPRIDIYRGARKKDGLYFGPYPSSFAVRETISLLQKLFRIRSCRDSYYAERSRPCLLYQINRCTAPCVQFVTEEAYRQQVALAILFLEGKSEQVIQTLQEKMEVASTALQYETAANFRDQILRLRQIQDKQYVNSKEGDADAIGFAKQAGIVCIQLLSIRHGQVLGSRAYFPSVPSIASDEEIIHAFLTQHYLAMPAEGEGIPKQIIVDRRLKEQNLISNVLSEYSQHAVLLQKPSRGNKKQWLQMAEKSAKQSLVAHLFNRINMEERIIALQKALRLPNPPKRMACFDISHTLGEATVASCVVFNQSGPLKSDYRRFNITDITPGDDLAAMTQVLLRRFKRLQKENAPLPDLVFIDGGARQLAVANQVMTTLGLEKEINLIGISKGPGRKPGFETLHGTDGSQKHLPSDSLALHLIQQIRDEAHRFAITGHRARRDKSRRQSTLELIPGVGAKRRRELLRYFGGIQGVAHASLEELAKVPGISQSIAERIYSTFHDATI